MSYLQRLIVFSMRNFWISKRGDINWPICDPDISPMDFFFLWEYLASKVFKINPELKEHIREEMQKHFSETLASQPMKISASGCSSVTIVKDHIWMMQFKKMESAFMYLYNK